MRLPDKADFEHVSTQTCLSHVRAPATTLLEALSIPRACAKYKKLHMKVHKMLCQFQRRGKEKLHRWAVPNSEAWNPFYHQALIRDRTWQLASYRQYIYLSLVDSWFFGSSGWRPYIAQLLVQICGHSKHDWTYFAEPKVAWKYSLAQGSW